MGPPCTSDERDDKRAARLLARLLESELGYPDGRIDSVALRLIIQAKWSRISALAHEIHGSEPAQAVPAHVNQAYTPKTAG